jgi:hypothetical protein
MPTESSVYLNPEARPAVFGQDLRLYGERAGNLYGHRMSGRRMPFTRWSEWGTFHTLNSEVSPPLPPPGWMPRPILLEFAEASAPALTFRSFSTQPLKKVNPVPPPKSPERSPKAGVRKDIRQHPGSFQQPRTMVRMTPACDHCRWQLSHCPTTPFRDNAGLPCW